MTKNEWENKSLVQIVIVCYAGNLATGWIGWFCPPESTAQLLLYQIGNVLAIAASVMAGRYTGLRGQHVAASAYILLAITHGVSFGAVNRTTVNVDRGMAMVMPMIPALVFMFWCDLYPKWVRAAGLVPAAFFTLAFINVYLGIPYQGWSLYIGYATLQMLEIVWGIYLVRDWQRNRGQRVT